MKRWFLVPCFAVSDNTMCLFLHTTQKKSKGQYEYNFLAGAIVSSKD